MENLALPKKRKQHKTTKYSCVCLTTAKGEDQMKSRYALSTAWFWSLHPSSPVQLPGIFYVVMYRLLSIVPTTDASSFRQNSRRPILSRKYLSFSPLLGFNKYWTSTTEKTDPLIIKTFAMERVSRKKIHVERFSGGSTITSQKQKGAFFWFAGQPYF